MYGADNLIGPVALLPALTAHVRAIEEMISHTPGALLDRLLRVASGYAEFAGWLAQDAGDDTASRSWYDRAREWADAAEDRRMSAFVLMRRAVQAVGRGDGAYAIRLAAAAQRDNTETTARVRAIAAQTEGLGYAVLGDWSGTERALTTAANLTQGQLAPAMEGDPSGGGRYCDLTLYLRITQAKAYLSLGNADLTVESFKAVLDALPPAFHRDRGQYLARLASATAMAGQPDQACGQAEESLTIAVATGSSRTIEDVRRFADLTLTQWPSLPEALHLRDILGSLDFVDRKA
jgi:tetratricopeptide (TPR) repeat protein